MLKIRMKRHADRGALALKRLSNIETSIGNLVDDDLLDLADIFSTGNPTPLADIAAAEMKRRNLTL